jgi:hypothetical protein
MYSWIWKKLPGTRNSKIAYAVLLFTAFALFMFIIGFPMLEHLFKIDQAQITE